MGPAAAAGDHAHIGDDIRDLEGTSVSLPVEPRLFSRVFHMRGGVNSPPEGQKIKNSAKLIRQHQKKAGNESP